MSWWPFKKRTPPKASVDALRAVAQADRDLVAARAQRAAASEIAIQLEVSRQTNGFGNALEAAMARKA